MAAAAAGGLSDVSQMRTRLEMEPVDLRFSSSAICSLPLGCCCRGCSPDTERRLGRNLEQKISN